MGIHRLRMGNLVTYGHICIYKSSWLIGLQMTRYMCNNEYVNNDVCLGFPTDSRFSNSSLSTLSASKDMLGTFKVAMTHALCLHERL